MDNKEKIYVHKLMKSEPRYKWFGRKIRDFIRNYVIIPEIPPKDKVKVPFEIYDHLGNKYKAYLDNQGRIWCREWYRKYPLKEGQEIIIKIEDEKIIISPRMGNDIQRYAIDEEKSEFPPYIKKLRDSQRYSEDPSIFEKTVVEAFNLLGFSARHIGGRDEPDVLIDEDTYKIIIDAKTTKEGIIQSESAIGFERLIRYKDKYRALYVGVIGPGFSEGYVRDTAKRRGIVLIETEALCKLLQNHTNYPYEKEDIVSMLFKSNKYIITSNDILSSTIHQQKLIDTSAKILTILKNFEKSGITSFTSETIRIALIGQGITCDTNEIEKSLKFLSEVPFQILQKTTRQILTYM